MLCKKSLKSYSRESGLHSRGSGKTTVFQEDSDVSKSLSFVKHSGITTKLEGEEGEDMRSGVEKPVEEAR